MQGSNNRKSMLLNHLSIAFCNAIGLNCSTCGTAVTLGTQLICPTTQLGGCLLCEKCVVHRSAFEERKPHPRYDRSVQVCHLHLVRVLF